SVLMDRPNLSCRCIGPRIHLCEISTGGKVHRLIQRWVRGYSPPKKARAIGASDLADQLEFHEPQILLRGFEARQWDSKAGDHAINGRDAAVQLDQGPHFERHAKVSCAGCIPSFK